MTKIDKIWREVFNVLMAKCLLPEKVTKAEVWSYQQLRINAVETLVKLMGDDYPSFLGIVRSEDIFNEVCDAIDEFERKEAYKEFDKVLDEVLGDG